MTESGFPRLSARTLASARSGTVLPGYDRGGLETGIVHLGLGAFVRAHIATYIDDLLAIERGPWGIAGVSLKRPDQRNLLAPQDGLYATLQRDGSRVQARIIGCVRQAIVAPEDPAALVSRMAQPACRIVSLTITEKGYCHDPATGRLDPHHPDIRHDLAHKAAPRSAIGLIVAALQGRRAAGLGPFTVLCCDNLPHNGRLVSGLARDFAALQDDGLSAWIEANGAFPSTMVDRIVPASTRDDVTDAAERIGLHDAAPVSHEPFRQWVIEDRFVGARPAWERVGAQLVTDVGPYEHMKLRLLNGAHSALAYLGYLAGHETIADVAADPVFREYVVALWDEIIPVVPPPRDVDLRAYAADLLSRFENTAIRHRTWQIAMDGSQKLPQRLLSTIRERLAQGLPIPRLALAVAAWIRYVGGTDEAGRPIDVHDPLADRLRAALEGAGPDPARRVASVLRTEAVFGADLPASPAFVAAVTKAYANLLASGARVAAANGG
ncbi:MAG TPA: mannitol dehydrogenase family protein [Acetobacteraceae bacterium]|nr:mannitol dehydrogenase family protein [Acetobacteraceae bacterium]